MYLLFPLRLGAESGLGCTVNLLDAPGLGTDSDGAEIAPSVQTLTDGTGAQCPWCHTNVNGRAPTAWRSTAVPAAVPCWESGRRSGQSPRPPADGQWPVGGWPAQRCVLVRQMTSVERCYLIMHPPPAECNTDATRIAPAS